jgi:hypothetical protein
MLSARTGFISPLKDPSIGLTSGTDLPYLPSKSVDAPAAPTSASDISSMSRLLRGLLTPRHPSIE